MYFAIILIFLLVTIEISHSHLKDRILESDLPYGFKNYISNTANRKLWFEYLNELLTVLQESDEKSNIEVGGHNKKGLNV